MRRRHRQAHVIIWLALAIALPLLLAGALTLRVGAGEPPVRLSAPGERR
jgi:hypothetical protein